ncbi:hypothetical protein HD806DRAFT_550854 [Xylariaceae sp. AK1471]|nr:hypothetical protein HD806DRAFT_550854 [Xylariaceae sp. AK1471]
MSIRPSDIYVGFWTDWSKNDPIRGATITLSSNLIALLVAFLALFVSVATSHLWSLISYMIHYRRQGVTQGRCCLLLRQQQVVFKSGLSAASTIIRLGKLFWVNRSAPSSLKYSWLPILLSTICATIGIVAGLYSSRIIEISTQIEVLLNSRSCISLQPIELQALTTASLDNEVLVANQFLEAFKSATDYSQQCYNTTEEKECSLPTIAAINWITDWDAKCPFDEIMCLGPAMQLDTSRINSNTMLGINSPVKDQVDFRKVTTCAPITQENYTIKFTNNTLPAPLSYVVPGDEYIAYTYGAANVFSGTNITVGGSVSAMFNYVVGVGINDFSPIPELNAPNGDGTLFFIKSNSIQYSKPCDDPVFAAHVPIPSNLTFNTYVSDHLIGVIGCFEQYQFCDPSKESVCSLLGSKYDAMNEALNMPLTPVQNATIIAIGETSVSISGVAYGNTNLLANQKLLGYVQLPLPSNQWQIEVQGWHATTMAILHQALNIRVLGFGVPEIYALLEAEHPISPADAAVCRRQRVRYPRGGFANVSGLGFFLVILLGTLIILTDLFLSSWIGLFGKYYPLVKVREKSWIYDDVLHLQRLAYMAQERAEREHGSVWIDTDKDIPRVESPILLRSLIEPEIRPVALEPHFDNQYSKISVTVRYKEDSV